MTRSRRDLASSAGTLTFYSFPDARPLVTLLGHLDMETPDPPDLPHVDNFDDLQPIYSDLPNRRIITLNSSDPRIISVWDLGLEDLMRSSPDFPVTITSTPPALVFPGQRLSYQVTLNTPDQVKAYGLAAKVEGMQINSHSGLLEYTPPAGTAGKAVPVAITIELKDSIIIRHEFVILVASPYKPSGSSKEVL